MIDDFDKITSGSCYKSMNYSTEEKKVLMV